MEAECEGCGQSIDREKSESGHGRDLAVTLGLFFFVALLH